MRIRETMKKSILLLASVSLVLVFGGVSFAEDFTYETSKLNSFSHGTAYSWGINVSDLVTALDNGEEITSVTLTFKNIYEDIGNDILYISYIDSSEYAGTILSQNSQYKITEYTDSTGGHSNYFTQNLTNENSDNATQLSTIENVGGTSSHKKTITITSSEEGVDHSVTPYSSSVSINSSNYISNLTEYIFDNVLTIGLDMDCHYNVGKISLVVTTSTSEDPSSTVPEPSTLLLFGLGLIGASILGRKRRKLN